MGTKTFKKADIEEAVWEDTDENSPLVLVGAGEWINKGKFQYQENILQDTSTELYYSFMLTRSGSYFSEYRYSFEWARDDIKLKQVTKITKVIKVWSPVELGEVNIT